MGGWVDGWAGEWGGWVGGWVGFFFYLSEEFVKGGVVVVSAWREGEETRGLGRWVGG